MSLPEGILWKLTITHITIGCSMVFRHFVALLGRLPHGASMAHGPRWQHALASCATARMSEILEPAGTGRNASHRHGKVKIKQLGLD